MRTEALSSSGWKASAFCPQCGGKVEVDAGDPVLFCDFCKTGLYMIPYLALRYLLPQTLEPETQSRFFYVPYWRFRGIRYRTLGRGVIDGSFMDATFLALSELQKVVDYSLGIRPQAMPLQLSVDSSILPPPDIDRVKGLSHIDEQLAKYLPSTTLFKSFVGESVCIIYAPFEMITHNSDKILIRSLFGKGKINEIDSKAANKLISKLDRPYTNRPVRFLPLLCPECGHDLPAEKGGVILRCMFCDKAWAAVQDRFKKIEFIHIPAPDNMVSVAQYLPFWKITMNLEGFPAQNRKEFKKVLISYQHIPDEWEKQPVTVAIPAFKLNPSLFLRIARGLTLFSGKLPEVDLYNCKKHGCRAHAVTLSGPEALKAVRVFLASLFSKNRRLEGLISKIDIQFTGIKLLYMPFIQKGYDLSECYSGQSVPLNALSIGKKL